MKWKETTEYVDIVWLSVCVLQFVRAERHAWEPVKHQSRAGGLALLPQGRTEVSWPNCINYRPKMNLFSILWVIHFLLGQLKIF